MENKLNILFFGDSITWCQKGSSGERAPINERWTTIIANEFNNLKISAYGIPGMAVGVKPWGPDDWHTTSQENQFVEKIIKTHYPEVDHVFLYFGTNNYFANYEKARSAKSITTKIKTLHDAITKMFNVKIHIINLQSMHFHNGSFPVAELQTEITKTFPNAISLEEVISHGKDKIHMAPEDNKLIAKIIIKYIKEKIIK